MEIRLLNYRVGHLVADYLDAAPCSVTPELLAELLPEGADATTEEFVYAALLSGFFGLDGEVSAEDRFIEEQYLRPGLRRMDPAVFRDNPYYRNIQIKEQSIGQWALTRQSYRPYELFLRDDLILTDDLRQIPAIGYFPEAFSFPSVLQDGREWMSIKPSEIASTQPAVDAAFGRVVTFGLGLGYFAYMAACKPGVASVTVVERDPAVIALFEGQILPQFGAAGRKIQIVQADAFDFMDREMEGMGTDYVFMDIWHDISDGLDPYVRAKAYEARFPDTRFRYWIERSLRCALIDVLEHRFS